MQRWTSGRHWAAATLATLVFLRGDKASCLFHATQVNLCKFIPYVLNIHFLGFECSDLVCFYCCGVLNSLAGLQFFLCGYNVNSTFLLGRQVVELDLKTVVPCCSGPKRPQDKVAVSDMKKDFESCLGAKVGAQERRQKSAPTQPTWLLSARLLFTSLNDESP